MLLLHRCPTSTDTNGKLLIHDSAGEIELSTNTQAAEQRFRTFVRFTVISASNAEDHECKLRWGKDGEQVLSLVKHRLKPFGQRDAAQEMRSQPGYAVAAHNEP